MVNHDIRCYSSFLNDLVLRKKVLKSEIYYFFCNQTNKFEKKFEQISPDLVTLMAVRWHRLRQTQVLDLTNMLGLLFFLSVSAPPSGHE